MSVYVLLAFIFLVCLTAADSDNKNCGRRPIQPKKRFTAVVGGTEAVPNSWPWMVAILRIGSSGSEDSRFLCGGSLLNARYVITAAHCFQENLPASRYQVLVGSNVNTEGTKLKVKKMTVHEDYVPSQGYNDIAIIQLAEEAQKTEKIGAVCLPQSSLGSLSGKMATITGWGDKSFGGERGSELREVQLPIVENKVCNKTYFRPDSTHFKDGIIESQVCAGGLSEGGKDACQGDSGGPLVLETGTNRWSIVGIVSFGHGCADPGVPGVYTRLSSFLPWIKEQSGIVPP